MTDQMNIDLDQIRALALQFTDHVQTLNGLGGHDSADQITAGLTDTAVGSACSAAADATQSALTAITTSYGTLIDHAKTGAGVYEGTESVSKDRFTAVEKSV